jgi:hypothetical protein
VEKINWNESDIELLKKYYSTKGSDIPELSKKFSHNSIRQKASRLKFKNKLTKKWTKEEDDYIKKNIKIKSHKEISNDLCRTSKSISGRVYRSLHLKSGFWKKANYNFFKTWSDDMAYILGYWFADGYISSKGYLVGISSKDISIINSIKKILNANHKILTSKKRVNEKEYTIHSLVISNKEMYNDIKHLGGVARKSLIATFPYIPNQYIRHFIRGYFDGDGSISVKKGNCPCITFVGTKCFIESLMNNLPYKKEIRKHKNIYIIGYSGKKAQDILEYMYNESRIYLKRKYKLYKKAINWKHFGWTDEEKLLLKENYPLLGYKIPELLKNHTHCSISHKAQRMNLKYVRQ